MPEVKATRLYGPSLLAVQELPKNGEPDFSLLVEGLAEELGFELYRLGEVPSGNSLLEVQLCGKYLCEATLTELQKISSKVGKLALKVPYWAISKVKNETFFSRLNQEAKDLAEKVRTFVQDLLSLGREVLKQIQLPTMSVTLPKREEYLYSHDFLIVIEV